MKELKALARVGSYLLPATVIVEDGSLRVLLGSLTTRTTALRGSLSTTEIGEIVAGREIVIKVDHSYRISIRRLRRKLRPTDSRDRRLLKELGIGPQGFKERTNFFSNLYVVTVTREDLGVTLIVDQKAAIVLKNLLRSCGASSDQS